MRQAAATIFFLSIASFVQANESLIQNHLTSQVNTVTSAEALGCGTDRTLPFVPVEAKSEPKNAGYFLFTMWLDDLDQAAKGSGDFSRDWYIPLNSGDYYYRGDFRSIIEDKSKPSVIVENMNELPPRVRFSPQREDTIDAYSQLFDDKYPDMSHLQYETGRGTVIYPGRIRQVDHMSDSMETWFLYEVCEKTIALAE